MDKTLEAISYRKKELLKNMLSIKEHGMYKGVFLCLSPTIRVHNLMAVFYHKTDLEERNLKLFLYWLFRRWLNKDVINLITAV